jgi:MtN3 and saliva related transmembrane protein
MITELMTVLATLAGVLMSASGIPQILKIRKLKSSKDISTLMISIFIVGNLIWILYGALFGNYPIMITNTVGIFVWGGTMMMVLRYRK